MIEFWKEVNDEDDETSINSVQCYKFGHSEDGILNMPFQIAYNQASVNSLTYYSNSVSNYFNSPTARFYLVNGIPFRWMYGKCTNVITDQQRTVTNLDANTGIKPRLTIGKDYDDALNKDIQHGAVIDGLTLNWQPDQAVECILGFKGLNRGLYNQTPTTPIFPSSISSLYNVLTHLKWNDEAITNIKNIQFKVDSAVQTFSGTNGLYTKINDFVPIKTELSFYTKSIGANLLADARAGTKRRVKWKMSKHADPNSYFEIDSGSANVLCTIHNADKTIQDILGWNVTFLFENVSIDINDYVDTDFYSVPI